MLASGFVLMASDWLGWRGAFVFAAAIFFGLAVACLIAPPRARDRTSPRGNVARRDRGARALAVRARGRSPAFALGVRVADRRRDEVVGARRRVLALRASAGALALAVRSSRCAGRATRRRRGVAAAPHRRRADEALVGGPCSAR